MQKILLIDIGNTNIVLGICESNFNKKSNIISYRFNTNISETVDEIASKIFFCFKRININSIQSALISSVVPQIDDKIKQVINKYVGCKIIFIDNHKNNIMPITYTSPLEIGADRIVNAFAGTKLYGKPLIIVDMGTATTIDIVSKDCAYCGGIIFQGIEMALEGLCNKTAKLPKINLIAPSNIIGQSTIDCIRSGVYYSFLGGIKYIVDEIKKQKKQTYSKVILTGGYTSLYKKETEIFDVIDENLTLKGLAMLYNKKIGN